MNADFLHSALDSIYITINLIYFAMFEHVIGASSSNLLSLGVLQPLHLPFVP